MSKLLSTFFFCAVLAGCASVQPGPDTERIEQEIAQASELLSQARQRGDVTSFVAHFTDDAIYMVPGLADAAGRAAIETLAHKRLAPGRIGEIKTHRRQIDVVGDVAYELAWFSESGPRDEQSMRMDGRHFIVWSRAGNSWRVHRYLYNFSGAVPLP